MKKLLAALLNPWLWLAIGLCALALVIWVIGPLLAIGTWRPLDSATARLLFIGAIVALVALRKLWAAWRAKTSNAKVVDQLLVQAPPGSGADAAASAELKVLGERFAKALQTLKGAKFEPGKTGVAATWAGISARIGKRYLYELPWYAIIGAPGSGKTTALVNSGLEFPLAAALGEASVRGVGGTRNCDWWFTNQAVLIDTAGRYTTHDSDQATDSKAWEGFLGLLKSSRPRQPLNGVLVTVSVTDLLTQSSSARAQHATALRQRVQELHRHLGFRFPIYLLVTKCDLLAGFVETLGNVDKEARATPWGFTFRMDPQQRVDLSAFGKEFDALEQRLTNGLIGRLQLERDPQRRARIYAFPQQFEGLRALLQEFISRVFSASQFEADPLLRGVYFVSGTQEGTPIDRMLGRIARAYRLERTVVPPHAGSGKSFFLTRLLSNVVFAESALAGTDVNWERRRAWFAAAGYVVIALVGVGALTAWGVSTYKNQAYVAKVDDRVTSARALVLAPPNQDAADLLVLLPAFEATRNLARAGIGDARPVTFGFGLYQGRKLDAASQQAYRRMLADAMLPRIALRIEDQLKSGNDNPELQYEALKAYVMLYEPARFDQSALAQYVLADWKSSLPRSVTTEQRSALESHLEALLGEGPTVSPLAEDKALISQVRARLAATPLPERVYRRLKLQGIGAEFPEFTIAKAAGPGAAMVFVRANNAPLTQGVAGLYTYDGYHKGFQREVERVTRQLADEESWVLGVNDPTRQAALRAADVQEQLADQVRRLHLLDYAQVWEDFIKGIKMLPTGNLAQTAQMALVLSQPNNPLVPLLKAMSHQTTLGGASSVAARVESKARGAIQRPLEEIRRILGVPASTPLLAPGTRVESLVDDRFVSLRHLVTAPDGKGPAPIDATVALIKEVHALLIASDRAFKEGNVPPRSDLPDRVKGEAQRMPEPLRSLLTTLWGRSWDEQNREVLANINRAIGAQISPFCRDAISGRYPFVRSGARDVTQEDFGRLFAPGGLFDVFFQQNLAPFVDTSTKPWSFRQIGGAPMGASSGGLAQFQRAATLRDTFFRAGGNAPGLRLDFRPLEMDTTITQFILDVDGQLVKYAHGPQIPAQVQWPGPRGNTQVRVAFSPVLAAGSSGLVTDGPWALFKLFDRLQVEPAGAPERFRVTFNIEGRKAVFNVTTSSVRNPFRLPELEAFSCPDKL